LVPDTAVKCYVARQETVTPEPDPVPWNPKLVDVPAASRPL
jgi:hypothetical protein